MINNIISKYNEIYEIILNLSDGGIWNLFNVLDLGNLNFKKNGYKESYSINQLTLKVYFHLINSLFKNN